MSKTKLEECPGGEKQTVFGTAQWEYTTPAVGRSKAHVRCCCGYWNAFYTWSWAGHGKAKCSKCGCWIRYVGLDVYKFGDHTGS